MEKNWKNNFENELYDQVNIYLFSFFLFCNNVDWIHTISIEEIEEIWLLFIDYQLIK